MLLRPYLVIMTETREKNMKNMLFEFLEKAGKSSRDK